MRVASALASVLAMLALAVPAAAQEAVVGEGTVITDPASETEAPEPADEQPEPEPEPVSDDVPAPEPDASGKRGELHVLGAETSTSPDPAAPAGTLPFTGVDAWELALAGLALLGSGLAVRRATRPAFHTRPGPR